MALTLEWKRRIDHWRGALQEQFYRPLKKVEFQGFTTRDRLSTDQVLAKKLGPMPQGTRWGAKWEYAWFKGSIALPDTAKDRRIVMKIDVGGESRVIVNQRDAGAVDQQHHVITLTRRGATGQRFDVLVEAYAGHGAGGFLCGGGPITPPDRLPVPEPPPTQALVGDSTFGIWQEDAYQLWIDVQTLYELRNVLAADSLRVAEIDRGLRDFSVLVDFDAPHEELMESFRACRKRLKPLLDCINGSTTPLLYAVGHSHIDMAWLWPLAETERKCARTFSTQLALLEEYPEYRFLQSQPHLYGMTKALYPELYARIRSAAKDGKWIPEGGMWVESDTNMPSGESLIRQFIHGKRFFRDEFGVESQMLWLPDVFGYSGALPQILQGCGIKYFATAKIFWNYNGGDPFPYNTFTWEGIDGSEVLAHLYTDYNSLTSPRHVMSRWNERVQKDGISARLVPFGYGDGGGGPTRDELEYLRRERNLEGLPRTRIAPPSDFFKELENGKMPPARYVGELYYQCHRGTYTSQARTKRGNRKSEVALREAEVWGTAARALRKHDFTPAKLDEAWKKVLLNQFHDIIPGSSIRRVYEEAEAAYKSVLHGAKDQADHAVACFADKSPDSIAVFNSLSWERTALVALPKGFDGVHNAAGESLPVQVVEGESLVEAKVPSCGWTTLTKAAAGDQKEGGLKARADLLENEVLRLTLDKKGEITGIFDKESHLEFAAGPCNSLRMYKDVPGWFEAWDIDSMYEQTPVALEEPAEIQVVASGPLIAILRIKRKLHRSELMQEIRLRRRSRQVEFRTVIEWQESQKLLKVAFPVRIHANEAVHEIQFGHVRRPTHQSRPFDADQFEVANQKWSALCEERRGVALLNDCKYGLNVRANSINLTLLRSPLRPDMNADKGRQEFVYAFYGWNGSLADSDVVREAYELNCPVVTAPGSAGQQSLFSVSAPNVVVETVKPAEDGSPDVIVRLYEAKRTTTRCALKTTLPVRKVVQTDMLEREEGHSGLAAGRDSPDVPTVRDQDSEADAGVRGVGVSSE